MYKVKTIQDWIIPIQQELRKKKPMKSIDLISIHKIQCPMFFDFIVLISKHLWEMYGNQTKGIISP